MAKSKMKLFAHINAIICGLAVIIKQIVHSILNDTKTDSSKHNNVSLLPMVAPIVDIPKVQTSTALGIRSKVAKYTAIHTVLKQKATRLKTAGILPVGKDVRPFIANPEKYALNMARLKVHLELFGIQALNGYISKNGSQSLPPLNVGKKQVILLTYWRSGSTFVGDLLNQYPGTFYHFEPLHSVSKNDMVNSTMEEEAITMLSDLLHCDFSHKNDYLNWVKQPNNQFLFQHNTRLWSSCRIKTKMCFDGNFLSKMCNEYPFQLMKVTRLSLQPLINLLDEFPELKIIYLVRDPRGIFSSRSTLEWCKETRSCIEPDLVCSAMRRDLAAAAEIQRLYQNRLILLRYEDISLDPETKVGELFKFLQLNLHGNVLKFVKSHTKLKQNETDGGPYSTKRNSKAVAYAWKSKLPFPQVLHIQSSCYDVISGLGYDMVNSEIELNGNATQIPL